MLLNEVNEYVFNSSEPDEMDYAEDFFNIFFFNEINYMNATSDLLELGARLRKYSIEEILDYDNWDVNERNEIKSDIEEFAHNYGLLGILNRIFVFGIDEYYDCPLNEFENSRVNTVFNDIPLSKIRMPIFNKTNQNLHDIWSEKKTLNTKKYMKIFFPDSSVDFFEGHHEYIERYNLIYSEPIYLFLLQIKLFYDDYDEFYASYINSKELSSSLFNSIIKTDFVFSQIHETYVLKYEFNSLIELLSFYIKKQLMLSNEAVMICQCCKRPFVKNPKRNPRYCSKACGNLIRQRNFTEKNRKSKEK